MGSFHVLLPILARRTADVSLHQTEEELQESSKVK